MRRINTMGMPASLLIAGLILCGLAGGCADRASKSFSSVNVSLRDYQDARGGGASVTLRDPAAVDKAASFFPGFADDHSSAPFQKWTPKVMFIFQRPYGGMVIVMSDYTHWNTSAGRSDQKVRGNLEAYVKKLFAENQP